MRQSLKLEHYWSWDHEVFHEEAKLEVRLFINKFKVGTSRRSTDCKYHKPLLLSKVSRERDLGKISWCCPTENFIIFSHFGWPISTYTILVEQLVFSLFTLEKEKQTIFSKIDEATLDSQVVSGKSLQTPQGNAALTFKLYFIRNRNFGFF